MTSSWRGGGPRAAPPPALPPALGPPGPPRRGPPRAPRPPPPGWALDRPRTWRARAFIDATGDAVLAAACGVPCKVAGRDWPFQPATVCSIFSGINWDHPAYTTNRGTDAVRDAVKHELLPKANADGHFTHPDHFIAGMKKIGNATGNLNGGHIYGLDGLSVKSLTEGMISGRRLAVEYTEF